MADDLGVDLVLTAKADPEVRAVISTALGAYNEAHAGKLEARPLNILLTDGAGVVAGGLWGRTYWRWLYVELLFVPETLRGRQLGGRLLAKAEDEARRRDCVGAWLDTFSFQAPRFYERLGYVQSGSIADHPPGHARHFYAKRL